MDRQELLRRAFYAGHSFKVAPDLTLEQILSLDLNHKIAQQIWKSWREADANFDTLLLAEHGRYEAHDDSFGPATERLVQLPRCAVPDHPAPAGLQLPEAMLAFDTAGEGSWPIGCVPGYEDTHAIRINLDTSNAAAHWLQDLSEIEKISARCYAEMGLHVIYVRDEDPLKSEIEKKFESIRGGVIGWNEFPRRGVCRQTISGRLDNDYRASTHMRAILEIHETGHGIGLQHTRGGIMNPSILNVPATWRSDPHETTLKRYFGGRPVPTGPRPEPPEPGPPEERPVIDGVLVVNGHRYIVVPEPTP